jgi:hypothetical protein
MKSITMILITAAAVLSFSSCSTGPRATTGTAVGAVAGAAVAGPVGLVAGGAVGNAYGGERDRRR